MPVSYIGFGKSFSFKPDAIQVNRSKQFFVRSSTHPECIDNFSYTPCDKVTSEPLSQSGELFVFMISTPPFFTQSFQHYATLRAALIGISE